MSRICEHLDCMSIPIFGFPNDEAKFCTKHKLVGMIDLKHKSCEHPDCMTIPNFGFPNDEAKFCTKHKLVGMINVVSKTCEYPDCKTQPNFGLPNEEAKFCAKHKLIGMVGLKSKTCQHPDCKTIPIFGFPNEKAKFCTKHKLVGMIDLKSKTCEHPDCKTQPKYNLPGLSVSKCTKHREVGMILKPTAKCKTCKEPAMYGKNFILKYCETHKEEDDTNYVEKECISCNLIMVLDKDNHCEYCNPETRKTAPLAKQNALMSYLDSRGLTGTSTDRIVEGGMCGKQRPDRVFELPDKIIILECDEHQHKNNTCECEVTRMINLSQTYGGMPVLFIRWNPDDYVPVKPLENILT